METKSLWQIIKGSLTGTDNEGSAKRMLLLYFAAILLTSLTMVYNYCFYLAAIAQLPTITHIKIVAMYEAVNFSYQLSIMIFAGLATFEGVITIIKTVFGKNSNDTKDVQ